jgi:hypothetical protein
LYELLLVKNPKRREEAGGLAPEKIKCDDVNAFNLLRRGGIPSLR